LSLAAHAGGRVVAASITLLLAPVYARRLGLEAYGLVGIFTALQGLFALFDMGLGTALNRELAMSSADDPRARSSAVRTFEVVYVAIGVIVAAFLAAGTPFLRGSWVNSQALSAQTVTAALLLMAVGFAVQWPSSLYFGGLLGLQRHVVANAIQVFGTIVRAVGALVVIVIHPSVVWFFGWNALAAAVQTIAMRAALVHQVSMSPNARIDFGIIVRSWRLAAGLTGIAITSALLTQVDKVLLAKLLPLDVFGRYALSSTAANGLYNLAAPVFAVAFPSMTRRFAAGGTAAVAGFYHFISQLMVIAVVPASVLLIAFPTEILFAWTGDQHLAVQMSRVVALLAAGTALNGLMMVPYALQIAVGWTSLALWSNVFAVMVLPPLMLIATRSFGAAGAAGCWLALNAGYLAVQPMLLHRRFLHSELRSWMFRDIAAPVVVVATLAVVTRQMLPPAASRATALVQVVTVGMMLLLAALASTGEVRRRAWRFIRIGEPIWT
jgi:O-antigen/teichoic acid export membrane protein